MSFFLIIINSKIVIKNLLDSIRLINTQTFYMYKLTKVFIVYKDKNFIFTVF